MSHVNTDFDALASMLAAKKLHPKAQLVISGQQDRRVREFLNIYRDTFDIVQDNQINWSDVTELILVDVASLTRVGNFTKQLNKEVLHITVYDHHPPSKGDVKKDAGMIEQVGATVTILVEEIKRCSIPISPLEATLFGLGLYTDTGFFTFKHTTSRDLQVASYLMEQGMNLDMIQRFAEQTLQPEQQELLNKLFLASTTYEVDGLKIVVSSCQHKQYLGGLSVLTNKLLDIKGADALITVVGMKKNVFIVGRANSDRISLLPLLKKWGGGGHKHAGSAMIKNGEREALCIEVKDSLDLILKSAMTAREMMTSPVKTILPETTIEKAGSLMYRYGHSGYPVVKNEQLLGIITRRDLDKATHHGLGHAPVKAYMSTNIMTIEPDFTLEEIQNIIIEHNIGRLPVLEDGKLIGIITRTNMIEAIHSQALMDDTQTGTASELKDNVQEDMKQQLPEELYTLLTNIGQLATRSSVSVYLIGGIVRDILLQQPNDDIDIVVEGNGIDFANNLQATYGGEIVAHESFGTATWDHPLGLKIDIASSRLEFYDRPASLPDVELSTLREDLYRRDFTINAMAICLNEDTFGTLVDPFSGQADLHKETIKILHNLSFVEDPTRILRAVRFETRFDFSMDEQTEKLAIHSIEKVEDLSADRIKNDIERLFEEGQPSRIIRRLFELKFWKQFGVHIENERLSSMHASQLQTIYEKNRSSDDRPSWFNYFMIPFFYEGNMTTAKKFALTKNDAKLLREIVALKDEQWPTLNARGNIHRQLKNYSDEALLFFVAKENFPNKQLFINYLHSRSTLQTYLSGEDLLMLGLKPGPLYSEIFLGLEIASLKREVNSKEAAIKWAQQFINKQIKKERAKYEG